VLVSLDHGLTWKSARKIQPGPAASIDLTALVRGTYGYLVRFTTTGRAGTTAIESLNIRTWVQVAPISLPALKKGKTTFHHDTGDRYGRQTIPMLVTPNTADPNDLAKYVLQMPQEYDPGRHTSRIRGEVILRLTAPPHARISWFTIGGTFRTHQGEHAKQTDNRIAYAAGQPHGFQEIHRSQVPTWVNHWRYNWDGDVVLPEPAQVVYVKYTANTGLNTIRACLHLLPERALKDDLKIVHAYRVNGQLRTTQKSVTAPATYAVDCDAEPENVHVKLEVPHSRR
jgi:hypothetical protein